MELGFPPLYAELNRVSRDMELTHLEYLGPIQKAMDVITLSAERERTDDDKIKTGADIKYELGGVYSNMAGVYLLFRGVKMKDEWLQPWI